MYHNVGQDRKKTLSPLWESNSPYLVWVESPSTGDDLCQIWLKSAKWFWRKVFLNFVNVFFSLLILPPIGKGQDHSFEHIWISIHLKVFYANLVEIDPVILEYFFINFVNVFSLFRNYSPLGKGGAHQLNKCEFLPPKDVLCHVWLKMTEKMMKMWKIHRYGRRKTGNQKAHLSWLYDHEWIYEHIL